ncbi:chemotaxis protein CheA [Leptospira gomenensis]|uniref:Chemotaxis protein CheA n=1 Tax=Leptospira gomenensis TaxID=2484974 RepID=A0A5F1Z1W1_9LEPT|nr:chemotaxis protein CheA [Leptospira gomenensis]TGK35066.1 chemotaxis protein CheA [Leptospira gomenensis]TGK35256.1 chemotaxis protein CheA [Leptospira gomenensis]TGK51741.1 chemotaxis protein CheA [Leptospira gomenensis]TGK67611.1 chemotaxis protein CheA [Leptospira gomenensis]
MDLSEVRDTFISESEELLSSMESSLLVLEKDPKSSNEIHSVFRAVHTIKGTSGMFGYEQIETFTHDVETLLDRVRSGKQSLSKEAIEFLFLACDHIRKLVTLVGETLVLDDRTSKRQAELLLIAKKLLGEFSSDSSAKDMSLSTEFPAPSDEDRSTSKFWQITLIPNDKLFESGLDPFTFLKYLSGSGKIKHLYVYPESIPAWKEMNPEHCYLGFEISYESGSNGDEIDSTLEFLKEGSYIRILPPHSPLRFFSENAESFPLGKEAYVNALEIQNVLKYEEFSILKEGKRDPSPRQLEKGFSDVSSGTSKESETLKLQTKTLRVDSAKIDALISLVGELITQEANLSRNIIETENTHLIESSESLYRLVSEIREYALSLRMVPIADLFDKYKRVVRDLSKELNKQVELEIFGGETELDRSVIEKIADPIVHILRNALDHGIETSEVRTLKGKPAIGKLQISASHGTGSILIEIKDDGGGLNADKIRAKAIEKGLIARDQILSESEIYSLIFQPGFSTAEQVTNLSGRGVGMDVVLRNIESLRGTVQIQSWKDIGSSFLIRLPLTLAIIDGFLVRAGSSHFIVPMQLVRETVEAKVILNGMAAGTMNLRGELLPVLHLSSLLCLEKNEYEKENIVILEYEEKSFGIIVNDLQGEVQSVIRPMGSIFRNLKCFSGTSILGSGEIAFILDVPGLYNFVRDRETGIRETVSGLN